MLHQRMFESGTYKSLPEHIALYEALEASMTRAQRDEFLIEKDNSSQPIVPQSSTWKKFDTRDAPSSDPYDVQLVEDMPIPNSANKSDSEDNGSAHLPHVKPRPEWLKPIPEDGIPATPEPA
ncbi:hypothetical protein Tco_0639077 [Tanacetum coccineum]